MEINDVEERWNEEKPLYNRLGEITLAFLKNEIPKHEILPEISFRTKELLSIIKKIRRKSKEKDYSYEQVQDKLGIRVICSFSSDLEIIDKVLKSNFDIKHVEYKKDDLEYDKLDYTSNHYDVKINPRKIIAENVDELKDLVFEIQVRSINQHAWSSSAHILTYKRESEIPKKLQRRVYRLLSLYEIADDEFSNVNAALAIDGNSMPYNYIRKFEGKFYRYAGVDFDRETSLQTLKQILEIFNKEQYEDMLQKLESFIGDNNEKLYHIFNNNRIRYHQIPYLTQPEVFLVFYLIEKKPSQLENIYIEKLDMNELEHLQTIWGQ